MLAVLAANPYMGLEDANFKEIFGFLAIIGTVFVFLLIYRLVSIIFSARKDKKASLNTFLILTRTRGLSKAQTEFLAMVARRTKVNRPPRILESIEYFDKVLERFPNQVGLSEKQLILAESILKSCLRLDRETIEKEVRSFTKDDGKFKEAIVAL